MEDWLQEPVSCIPVFLMHCEWARGILIVTSFLDNPQQLLPWGWVFVCASVCVPMCTHEECYESDSNSQVSSNTNIRGMQTQWVTMATHWKQEAGGSSSCEPPLSIYPCTCVPPPLQICTRANCKHAFQSPGDRWRAEIAAPGCNRRPSYLF